MIVLCRAALLVAILILAHPLLAQKPKEPSEAELAEITARGRMLAEYDVAAWHATDAVLALKPADGLVRRYIARKTGSVWTVVFGRFSEANDKFLIAFEAVQQEAPEKFKVIEHNPPSEDTDFYFVAAAAIATALKDFGQPSRQYNVAAIPNALGQLYVYLVPAQTGIQIFPLGGDVRYLIAAGHEVLEKRQLHKAIIELPPSDEEKVTPMGRMHTHVLSEVPEDTDVFHVLVRKPRLQEAVGTKSFLYQIRPDGSIRVIGRR